MKKNASLKTKANHRLKGIALVTLGVVLFAISSAYAYQWGAAQLKIYAQRQAIAERKHRILAIYDSLKLAPGYVKTDELISGQKMLYEWDKSRSYSSSRTYLRQANVDTTVAELRQAIERAGFTFFEEPYPGSTFTELHFKSAKNEYVRLNVSGKPHNDALRQQISQPAIDFDKLPSPNQGPSIVVIKVNLDDNNE